MFETLIIGGGLAGLTNAILLARAGLKVALVEKKSYPFHKVCGEYVSNEVLPFLKRNDLDPSSLQPAQISRFRLVSPKGAMLETELDMGGFGLSRYAFDDFLYHKAREAGVTFYLDRQVNEIQYLKGRFSLQLSDGSTIESELAVGAYGKRSKLDRQLGRKFFTQRSPYVAVKYHIRLPQSYAADTISLYNFSGGYCGLNKIEGDRFCLCYLSARENVRRYGNIEEMEKAVLYKNPRLRELFEDAEMLFARPEVINEVSFGNKEVIRDHILMTGDAAGSIAPLCGNGMAMAIHAGQIAAERIEEYFYTRKARNLLENRYKKAWNRNFAGRVSRGRRLQSLFGKPVISEVAVRILKTFPTLTRSLISMTHGEEW